MAVVSIWILDKRSMAEGGASPAEIEAAAETARRDASALARIKHPAVVKVCCAIALSSTFLVETLCCRHCAHAYIVKVCCATSFRFTGSTPTVLLPPCTCPAPGVTSSFHS